MIGSVLYSTLTVQLHGFDVILENNTSGNSETAIPGSYTQLRIQQRIQLASRYLISYNSDNQHIFALTVQLHGFDTILEHNTSYDSEIVIVNPGGHVAT